MEEICKLGATSAFNPEDVASEEGASLLPTAPHTSSSTRLAVYTVNSRLPWCFLTSMVSELAIHHACIPTHIILCLLL